VREIKECIELLNDIGVVTLDSPYRSFYAEIANQPLDAPGIFDLINTVDNEINPVNISRIVGNIYVEDINGV
jgi:hypothetical protein